MNRIQNAIVIESPCLNLSRRAKVANKLLRSAVTYTPAPVLREPPNCESTLRRNSDPAVACQNQAQQRCAAPWIANNKDWPCGCERARARYGCTVQLRTRITAPIVSIAPSGRLGPVGSTITLPATRRVFSNLGALLGCRSVYGFIA